VDTNLITNKKKILLYLIISNCVASSLGFFFSSFFISKFLSLLVTGVPYWEIVVSIICRYILAFFFLLLLLLLLYVYLLGIRISVTNNKSLHRHFATLLVIVHTRCYVTFVRSDSN
jgi:hypothetical protein